MIASVARRIAVGMRVGLAAALAALVSASPAQTVQIASPVPEQILPGPDVPVCVVTQGLSFVPGGCNLHIILDDGPFAVQYDPNHPYLLRDVAPGSHTLRVFAADRLHRAIPGTLDVVTFSVGYQDEFNRPAPGYPLLTVNLPQGEYLGIDAGDVAIDFMVDGVCLARRGYHVAYYVDGRRFFAYNEGARHLKGLPPGFHTVRFELLNERGDLVPGPFNSLERVILLSPHKTRHVATEEDVRRGLPIIESIRGAMTNGQPWVAGEPGPIALPRPAAVAVPGGSAPAAVAPGAGFAVRPGGRRVGPLVPAGESAAVSPVPAPAETLLPAETTTVREVEETRETLTVVPQNSEKEPAAEIEGEEAEKENQKENGEDAATGGSDAETTRDLRPAAFREKAPQGTSTLKVAETSATGSVVRRFPAPQAEKTKQASAETPSVEADNDRKRERRRARRPSRIEENAPVPETEEENTNGAARNAQ